VGQLQELPEQVLLGAGEFLDRDEVVAPAENAGNAEAYPLDQPVPQVLALSPRIGDGLHGFY
jgi:hypothetical protein